MPLSTTRMVSRGHPHIEKGNKFNGLQDNHFTEKCTLENIGLSIVAVLTGLLARLLSFINDSISLTLFQLGISVHPVPYLLLTSLLQGLNIFCKRHQGI